MSPRSSPPSSSGSRSCWQAELTQVRSPPTPALSKRSCRACGPACRDRGLPERMWGLPPRHPKEESGEPAGTPSSKRRNLSQISPKFNRDNRAMESIVARAGVHGRGTLVGDQRRRRGLQRSSPLVRPLVYQLRPLINPRKSLPPRIGTRRTLRFRVRPDVPVPDDRRVVCELPESLNSVISRLGISRLSPVRCPALPPGIPFLLTAGWGF